MRYVYYTYENLDEEFTLDELIVYETFDQAVQIAKELMKKEFKYIQSSWEGNDLDSSLFLKKDKEFFEGKIFDDDKNLYVITVQKIPLIS